MTINKVHNALRRKMIPEKSELLLVTWQDACIIPEKTQLKTVMQLIPPECMTVGFLVKYGRKYITLSSDISDCGTLRDTTIILLSMITRISSLTIKKDYLLPNKE